MNVFRLFSLGNSNKLNTITSLCFQYDCNFTRLKFTWEFTSNSFNYNLSRTTLVRSFGSEYSLIFIRSYSSQCISFPLLYIRYKSRLCAINSQLFHIYNYYFVFPFYILGTNRDFGDTWCHYDVILSSIWTTKQRAKVSHTVLVIQTNCTLTSYTLGSLPIELRQAFTGIVIH